MLVELGGVVQARMVLVVELSTSSNSTSTGRALPPPPLTLGGAALGTQYHLGEGSF